MGRSETWRVWWARLLPVLGLAAAAYCGYPFAAFLPGLALSLLLLLAITTVMALRFDRGGSVTSGPVLARLTGAWVGAVAARLDIELAVRASHSSTRVLTFFALSRLVPFAMIYFGTLGWGLASLLRTPAAPRPWMTLAGFWVPLLVVSALLAAGGLEIRSRRQWTAARAVAESPGTPAAELARLASNPDLRRYVARNQTTPEATLRTLAEDPETRASVAANPSAPPDLLDRLSAFDDCGWGVAVNRRSPVTALRRVADHPSGSVGRLLVDNPNTPDDVLEKLARDPTLADHATEVRTRRQFLNSPPVGRPAPAAEPR